MGRVPHILLRPPYDRRGAHRSRYPFCGMSSYILLCASLTDVDKDTVPEVTQEEGRGENVAWSGPGSKVRD